MKKYYEIPREWVKRLFIKDDGDNWYFFLAPYDFCCRQVLYRSWVGIVQCQSLKVDNCYQLDKKYFHIGGGACHESTHKVFLSVTIYSGLRNLVLELEHGGYDNPAEMMFALGQFEISMRYFKYDEEKMKQTEQIEFKHEMYSGRKLKKLLQHILVCKTCHPHLRRFLHMLDECVTSTHLYPQHQRSQCKLVAKCGVPCYKYVLDADFDRLREIAYNAPLEPTAEPTHICDVLFKTRVGVFYQI